MKIEEAIEELNDCLEKGLMLDRYPVEALVAAYNSVKAQRDRYYQELQHYKHKESGR